MSHLRNAMIKEMQLHRLAPGTQYRYLKAMTALDTFYDGPLHQLTPDQIRHYLHHLLTKRQLAWSSCNLAAAAIRFFYVETLGWTPFKLNLPPRTAPKRLPRVLSVEQLERLFATMANPKHRALLMTAYSAGLRIGEAVQLQVQDIESDRKLIRINQAKGNKDRYTLLSDTLLHHLRAYWVIERPRPWLFPGAEPGTHIAAGTAYKAYNLARRRAGIAQGQGLHTLRHSFATHLFDAGVDPRVIQMLLGHRSIKTTAKYLHVSRHHFADVRSPLDLLSFQDLALDALVR